MKTYRRQIREKILQALYTRELRDIDMAAASGWLLSKEILEDPNAMKFFNLLLGSIEKNIEEIDRLIAAHTHNWDMSRIAVIDKNILRMALAEILYCEDIPPKVSINEAIEIAKKFSSTDKSSKFVNGILDSTYSSLKAEGKIRKNGRGLIDHTPDKAGKEPEEKQD